MLGLEYGDLLGWALIAAAAVFVVAESRVSLGLAVTGAALAGMLTKTVLLGVV